MGHGLWVRSKPAQFLTQKMIKCVEVQVKVIKKIIGHLSEIEKKGAEKHKANHAPGGLTQEGIDHMMAERKVLLPLPNFKLQLKDIPGPWTLKRAHVNEFSKSGDA